jgi:hypothetical protein
MKNNNNVFEAWAVIVRKCWEDESYRRRVLSNPKEALKEQGCTCLPDVEYKVIEEKNGKVCVYLSLPQKPKPGQLSEDALGKFSGGSAGDSAG